MIHEQHISLVRLYEKHEALKADHHSLCDVVHAILGRLAVLESRVTEVEENKNPARDQ
jgi:hypothetical protein